MRRYMLLFSCVLLLGCCKKVVVTPCPPPPPVTQPTLRTSALTPLSPADRVVEAYVLDLADWVGYGKKLEALLDAYRTVPGPPPTNGSTK